jgi:hypothetical protein
MLFSTSKIGVPAKAGIHPSTAPVFDSLHDHCGVLPRISYLALPWVPAFAGTRTKT